MAVLPTSRLRVAFGHANHLMITFLSECICVVPYHMLLFIDKLSEHRHAAGACAAVCCFLGCMFPKLVHAQGSINKKSRACLSPC